WGDVGTPVLVIPGDGSPLASQLALKTYDDPAWGSAPPDCEPTQLAAYDWPRHGPARSASHLPTAAARLPAWIGLLGRRLPGPGRRLLPAQQPRPPELAQLQRRLAGGADRDRALPGRSSIALMARYR